MLDKLSLILLIIGGLNWGSVGIFQFDLVALAAIWCISLLFRDDETTPKLSSSV